MRAGGGLQAPASRTATSDRLELPHLLREQLHIAARRQRHQLKPVAVLRYDVERLRPY